MSKEQVRQIIHSVRDAVEKECWIPALATALIIPDVLGQIEFPEIVHKRDKETLEVSIKRGFLSTLRVDMLMIKALTRRGILSIHISLP